MSDDNIMSVEESYKHIFGHEMPGNYTSETAGVLILELLKIHPVIDETIYRIIGKIK